MNLKNSLAALSLTVAVSAAPAVMADHNSIWGPGTANMPNDIHNSAIEDDQETFLELVQQGGGADSVNRYLEDEADTAGGADMGRWAGDMREVLAGDLALGGGNLDSGGSQAGDGIASGGGAGGRASDVAGGGSRGGGGGMGGGSRR